MARKPRPSEVAKKKAAGTKPPKAEPKAAAPKAGRKPAASKPGQKPVGKGKAPEQKVMKLPPASVIRDLLNTQLQKAADIQAISGSMGSEVKEAADKKHVDKKAFAITKGLEKLARSNPAKFQVTWEHLMHNAKAADFQGRADRQGQLELRATPADEDEAEQAETAETETAEEPVAEPEPETPIEEEIPAGTDGEASPRMRLVAAS